MTHPTPWSLGEDAAGGRWITAADGFRVASVSAMADGDAELIVASVNAVAAAQAVLPSDERLASMIRSADASLRDPMTGRSPQRSGFYWRDMGHAVGVLLRTHVHNRAGKDEAAPEDGSQSLAAHGDRAGTAYTGPQDGPPMVDWFTAVLNMDGAQPAPAAPPDPHPGWHEVPGGGSEPYDEPTPDPLRGVTQPAR